MHPAYVINHSITYQLHIDGLKLNFSFYRQFKYFSFQDGVWVRGLYLEGAGWDKKNACLIEADPMQLVCPIPTIHFKPVENKKKTGKGMCHNKTSCCHLVHVFHENDHS